MLATSCLPTTTAVTYSVVYDEALRGYREWWFLLGLIAAALWILFIRSALRHFNRATADRLLPSWTVPFVLLIGIGGSALVFLTTYRPHARLRDALRSGNFRTVEGVVTTVQPGDPGAFVVATADGLTHEFHYSEHRWTPGYRDVNPAFRVGQRVRVAEVHGAIARLEVSSDSLR